MFTDKLKSFTLNFNKIFENKRILTAITIVGCIGILLIGASDWIFKSSEQITANNSGEISLSSYIETLEKKTQEMVLSINGAGKCKVMITAESSQRKEYATDDELKSDSKNSDPNSNLKHEVKTEIVLIESNGDKQALVTAVNQPKIRGVLVLCEGADTPKVKENITEAVKTVLGVSYNKICVIKLKI